jgi:hypothetical protein
MGKFNFSKSDAAKETDSNSKDVSRAWHQARNDYQDSGSPFGKLGNRDRSTKSDVKSKYSGDSKSSSGK